MRVCVLNTGGTISSAGTPLAPMPARRFARAAQDLLGPAIRAALPDMDLHFETALRFSDQGAGLLDSTDLVPQDWCRIAAAVLERYGDFDGFVILHGTDTMDFTAAALPLLFNVSDRLGIGRAVLSKPVILTGAQLPLFRETGAETGAGGLVLNAGSDGFANLCGALAALRLRLPETGLFFDGKLLRANRALKFSSTEFAGFDSPHLPPLARVGTGLRLGEALPLPGPAAPHLALDHPQARACAHAQLDAISGAIGQNPVVQIPAFPAHGSLARMIADAVAAGARGIVLMAYGGGNMPSGCPADPASGPVLQALRAADEAGVIVVDTSRLIAGQVDDLPYAAGSWLTGAGAIGGLDMTPMAAFAKLTLLLAMAGHHGWDRAALRALMRCDLAGECRALDRLDGRRGPRLWPGQQLQAADGPVRLINDPVRGLVLRNGAGRVLWSPAPGRVGSLCLEGSHLRLRAPDGTVLWSADAPGGADAQMILRDQGGQPALLLCDPQTGQRRRIELDSFGRGI